MKKIFAIIVFAFAMCITANAQYAINGNEIVQVKQDKKDKKTETSITTKMTYKHNGQVCQVKLSKNGRAYAEVTSKNGNTYKKYFGEEVSKALCKEYGVTYTEKKTR